MSRRRDSAGSVSFAAARRALLTWFRRRRRDLPWRRSSDAFRIWVSEIMLQQTRVDSVIPYYERFVSALPDVFALARAPLERVLELWAGLGYYRRARNLHAAARQIVSRDAGRLPRDAEAWQALPGVGRYTAAAIASIAFDQPVAALDGNIQRVLARFFTVAQPIDLPATTRRLWAHAEEFLDPRSPGDFNQALMELGATICTPRSPACAACPLRRACRAVAEDRQAELPRRSAHRKPVRVTAIALAVVRGDACLLVRRPARGLLGGLWCLPQFELNELPTTRTAERRLLRERLGAAALPGSVRKLGCLRHAFTHRHLELHVYRCELNGPLRMDGPEMRWQNLSESPRGIVARLDARALDLVIRQSAEPASPPSARARR